MFLSVGNLEHRSGFVLQPGVNSLQLSRPFPRGVQNATRDRFLIDSAVMGSAVHFHKTLLIPNPNLLFSTHLAAIAGFGGYPFL